MEGRKRRLISTWMLKKAFRTLLSKTSCVWSFAATSWVLSSHCREPKGQAAIRRCNQVHARAQIIRLLCDTKSSLRTSWEVRLVSQSLSPDWEISIVLQASSLMQNSSEGRKLRASLHAEGSKGEVDSEESGRMVDQLVQKRSIQLVWNREMMNRGASYNHWEMGIWLENMAHLS